MHTLTLRRQDVEAAWRSFIADGRLPDSVRPEILRSWRRVAEGHVDPALRACPRASGAGDALARSDAERTSRAVAPLVAQFADRLAADGHVVAYCDTDGVMLALEGNHLTRDRLGDVNFAPGACWAEHAAGTNAIGTALVEERPVEVFASEHFVEAWQDLACASVPVRFGGRIVGVVDITSPWEAYHPALLVTAEALARAVEARLEAELAKADAELLLQVARQAVQVRDEVLAVTSHELRTPLTPLALRLQRLRRLVDGPGALDRAAVAAALGDAQAHLGRVVDFIDDLRDVSSVGRGPLRLELEHTDLGATVRAVVARRRELLARQGCEVALTVADGATGSWDRRLVAQAFGHVLVNAAKHAPGAVEVEVEADAASARVRVRDHGRGIAPEDRERILLPFERAVSYRDVPGLGLGLHAARRIAEAHGGALRVEGALGEGSTFVLELPRRAGDGPR